MKIIGFNDIKKLPIQSGDFVIIPKGTQFTSTHPTKKSGLTKKNITIRVNHLLPGSELSESEYIYNQRHCRNWVENLPMREIEISYSWGNVKEKRYIVSNPSVRWAGAGGYWFEVDINNVKKVEQV